MTLRTQITLISMIGLAFAVATAGLLVAGV